MKERSYACSTAGRKTWERIRRTFKTLFLVILR